MHIEVFYDQATAAFTYVVSDESSKHCAIIDSVHDYDMYSGQLSSRSSQRVIEYITKNKLQVEWILETHVHADHLTAASYLKEKLGGKIGIGADIKKVLSYWIPVFNNGSDTPADGSQFDVLFTDGMQFKIGNLDVTVMYTPGHTPDSVSYRIQDAVFVGDTLFMPKLGTARADFPGGGAAILYQSIQKLYTLPDNTRIFVCHDYPPAGQQATCESSVGEQKKKNVFINESVTEQDFIATRNKRDSTLTVPKLLLPSIQTNLRAGKLGMAEANDVCYMKIPVKE